MNCYGCTDPIIRRGFIRGNNSPSGIGIMIENTVGGSGGLVEDVDCVYWGNGAFSAGEDSSGVQFWRCRARDGIDASPNDSDGDPDYQGSQFPAGRLSSVVLNRGQPSSGSEAFFAYLANPNVEYHSCEYLQFAAQQPHRVGPEQDGGARVCASRLHSPRPDSSNDAMGEGVLVRIHRQTPPQ